jgi:soluble lytic murein transglycosylase
MENSVVRIFLLLISFFFSSQSWALIEPIDVYRKNFLHVEQLIQKGNKELFLPQLSGLTDYPLYPFLMYQWLHNNLDHESEIKNFLNHFSGSHYAELLREDWLKDLSKRHQWNDLVNFYQEENTVEKQCQYYWALYNLNQKTKALQGMAKIWPEAEDLPRSCVQLEAVFVKSPMLTPEMIWQRFEVALRQDQIALAKRISNLFSKHEKKIANFWLRVHQHPALISQQKIWQKHNSIKSGLIFAHGVESLAKKQLLKAIRIWDQNQENFYLSKLRVQEVEKELAVWMVIRRNKSAYQRFNQLIFTDQEIREWRVRAALLENNWAHVISALNRLNNFEKLKPKWQYWRARAYWESGEKKLAKRLFSKIAGQRSFYGFIAADYLNRAYQLDKKEIKLPHFKLDNFVNSNEFKAVKELVYFKRKDQAREQWFHTLKQLPDWQLPAAVWIAQEQGWKQLASETIKLADLAGENKIGRYFSLAFYKQVVKHAKKTRLEPAIVFGLIRRESAFNENAVSTVGARGLMQIMPETGKYIAKSLQENWLNADMLFNPEVNLRYGTFYYKQMLNRFKGNFALAAAAYNAGPHRVRQWLPDDQPLPADIWIEMIPFDETRKYVVAVLTNAVFYQHQLGKRNLRISRYLKNVMPSKS